MTIEEQLRFIAVIATFIGTIAAVGLFALREYMDRRARRLRAARVLALMSLSVRNAIKGGGIAQLPFGAKDVIDAMQEIAGRQEAFELAICVERVLVVQAAAARAELPLTKVERDALVGALDKHLSAHAGAYCIKQLTADPRSHIGV